jgi:indole-3-glycerol phosphate synthase
MGRLQDIIAQKQSEIAALRGDPIPARPLHWGIRDVTAALRRPLGGALRLIAEIKFRSPSAGALSRVLGPADRARAYERGGAAMVSVLTDDRWFAGSLQHVAEVREATDLPVLCKDFLIDISQVRRAFAAGADAALVIVRCISGTSALHDLVQATLDLGIEPFVEVVDEPELERALAAGARVIGVNARDLDTLAMDAARAERVLLRIPAGVVAVHLSGLHTPHDAARIAASRADAALLGEALMRKDDPEDLLRELVRAAAEK